MRTRLDMAKSVLTELEHGRAVLSQHVSSYACRDPWFVLLGLSQSRRGLLKSGSDRNYRVLRRSATGKLCKYHGQPEDEMKIFWKKQVDGCCGVQLQLENSDTSDTL